MSTYVYEKYLLSSIIYFNLVKFLNLSKFHTGVLKKVRIYMCLCVICVCTSVLQFLSFFDKHQLFAYARNENFIPEAIQNSNNRFANTMYIYINVVLVGITKITTLSSSPRSDRR